jgi:hypothetical protein
MNRAADVFRVTKKTSWRRKESMNFPKQNPLLNFQEPPSPSGCHDCRINVYAMNRAADVFCATENLRGGETEWLCLCQP